jgi:hypothetical protein
LPRQIASPPALALLLAALPIPAGRTLPQAPGPSIAPAADRNVRFGLPGPAAVDPKDRERYLLAPPL